MSSTQPHDLHRAILRPMVIHTLRAAGFHSTKPSVLDTLVNLTERYLLLLASTTAAHAMNSSNEAVPSLADVRVAMQECGVLTPLDGAAEEEWEELWRRPVGELEGEGGEARAGAEKRKREESDVGDVREFVSWFDGQQHKEIKRVAGMGGDASAAGVGVGGGVVQADDFLMALKKRHNKTGDDSRFTGTVLGKAAEMSAKGVLVEGGPVQSLRDWRPGLGRKEGEVERSSAAAGP